MLFNEQFMYFFYVYNELSNLIYIYYLLYFAEFHLYYRLYVYILQGEMKFFLLRKVLQIFFFSMLLKLFNSVQ
jgi:hypothetical protein